MREEAEVTEFDVAPVNAAAIRQPLYEKRRKIHPKRAEGNFRRFKWLVMIATLSVYYITPWLRWDRGPYAPDQAVLIDIADRRFYFFFIEIWPQEFIFVGGLLVMAGLGLFLITSAVGRAWCGYTCPQTVWVDLFLVVERAIEGDRNQRIKLDKEPWTLSKIAKRVSKHAIWLLIAVATGGAWIFYFADAPTLARDFLLGAAPTVAYMTVGILTFTTYTLGGHLREQVCTYMCPWPRIQAAMLDENSLTVTYNDWRGEPRSKHAKKMAAEGKIVGDCVDCNACVAVCPMGIDIRDGQQLECITCALCIDACNGVMDKLNKPRGLISYSTLASYNENMRIATDPATGEIDPRRAHGSDGKLAKGVKYLDWHVILRPRTFAYFGAWALIGVILLGLLLTRDRLDITVQHDRNPIYVTLTDGSIRNGYTVKILNMLAEPRSFELNLEGMPNAVMSSPDLNVDDVRSVNVSVEPDKLRSLHVFVKQPLDALTDTHQRFSFVVKPDDGTNPKSYTAVFEGPAQ